MKIYVLVKQVPDTETRIKLADKNINEDGIKWIISPFDEHALEESLRLREKIGGTVTAVGLGPDRAKDSLRTAYALGADQAIHIVDNDYHPLDIAYAAGVLANFLKAEKPDIILTGHIAIDSQSSMVPAMVAEFLGCANINNAVEITLEDDRLKVRREIEGGTAAMESALPVVVTAAKNLNDPRYPSLKGIMASKKKQIEGRVVGDYNSGLNRLEVVSMELPPSRPQGRFIEGDDPEAKAGELMKLLREEAKVI